MLFLCVLSTSLLFGNGRPPAMGGSRAAAVSALTGKVTFRVDTRNMTVAASGMFVAGNFLSTIGYPNWSFQPMCDLGGGIWEVSFADIPAGLYQYKFVNGNAPAGWEFNGFGGPCTNPADNNNRWLTVTGGSQTEGVFCFNTCDNFCPGFGDPGVSDLTPPVILDPAPPDITLSCSLPLPVAGILAAEDGCDINVTTGTGPPTDDLSGIGPCGTGTIIRTWKATDCSGNSTEVAQTITVNDNLAPQITGTVPPAVSVSCGDLPAPTPLDAADLCDQDLVSTGLPTDNNAGIGPCGTGTLLRVWTATDCSGNTATATQPITLTDTEPPVIPGPVPAPTTVSCQDIPAGLPLAAEDACDGSLASTGPPVDDLGGLSPCGTGTIVRTWTATDCSGNSTSVSQLITVTDDIPPTIAGPTPPQLTIDCQQALPPPLALPATDACDPALTATSLPTDDLSGLSSCGTGTVVRTWTATDCSGNTASVTQTITVIDLTPPDILGIPPDQSIDCTLDLPPGLPLQASDGCDLSLSTTPFPTDDLSGLGPCGTGTVLRTWTVADCAGNFRSATQLLTITDLNAPFPTGPLPQDLIIACGNLPPGLPLGAADDCDPLVQLSGMPDDDLGALSACGTGTAIRTWTLTDCAANTAIVTQLLTLTDDTPPVLTFPATNPYTCGNVPTPAQLPPLVTDDCDPSPTLVLLSTDTIGSGCAYDLVRTWAATDCDGNTTLGSQVVTVSDDDPPLFVNPPADLSVCIGNVPPMLPLTWTDACDGTGTVTGTSQSNGATQPELITRTWQYTDACGNQVIHTQVITVSTSGLAQAGPDQTICAGDSAILAATGFGNADSVAWTTFGDGTFSHPKAAAGAYFPGPSDQTTGTVTLVFTPYLSGGSCDILPDTLELTIHPLPTADAGPDLFIRCNQPVVTLDAGASSGGPALTYAWTGPGLTGDSSGITVIAGQPGSYVLTVSTGHCLHTDTVSVGLDTMPPIVSAGADQQLSCDHPVATLTGQASGGDSLLVTWVGPGIGSGGSGELQTTVQLPGIYTLTVTDLRNGCSSQDSTAVESDGQIPVAAIAVPDILTCDRPAGWLQGAGSSTGPDITYQWLDENGWVSDSSALWVTMPGHYTLIVTDSSNGCLAQDSVVVLMDTLAPSADAGADRVLTCTDPSVILAAGPAGGTPALYQWQLGLLAVGQADTLSVQQAGLYTLTVTHPGNGCTATDSVLVTADTVAPTVAGGPDQTLTCTVQQVLLAGSATAGGGFQAGWNGPGTAVGNLQATVTLAGTYLLTIQDITNGCKASDTVQVFLDTLSPQVQTSPDPTLTCAFPATVLTGSHEPAGLSVQYQWLDAGGNIQSTDTLLSVQLPGTYRLIGTGTTNGCSDTAFVHVSLDTFPPLAVAGPDDTLTCLAPSLWLDAGASQGVGPLQFEWSGPGGGTAGDSLNATLPGTYLLSVTDQSNGCTAADTLAVAEDLAVPEAYAGSDQVLSCSQPSVVLSGSATPPQVTFQWTGPGISAGTAGLPQPVVSVAGTYELTVTSLQNGCTSLPVTVMVSLDTLSPTAQLSSYGQLDCDSQQVWIDGSASSVGSAFGYSWTADGIPIAGADQAGLQAVLPGSYQLTVTNLLNGCTRTAALAIGLDTTAPTVVLQGPAQLNCYDPVATLTATLSEPVDAPSYAWTTTDGQILTDPTAASIQGGEAGTYQVQVTDGGNGCTTDASYDLPADFTIPLIDLPTEAVIGCQAAAVSLLPVVQANGPISYQWVGPAGFGSTSAAPSVSVAGTYQLTVTQQFNGCQATGGIAVSTDPGITEVGTTVTPAACESRPGGTIEVSGVIGSGEPFGYALDGTTFGGSPLFTGLYAGDYTLTVLSATGCQYEVLLSVPALQPPTLTVGEDRTILLGDSIQLTANLSGSTYMYNWSGSGTLSCGDCPDPVARPFETTDYELSVVDENGCEQTASVRITVDPRLRLYAPNAFSPNGDGINDHFRLYPGPQVSAVTSLRLFDRWGGLVADLSADSLPAIETGWDGTMSGERMPAGIYVYLATVLLVDGRQQLIRGEVLLAP